MHSGGDGERGEGQPLDREDSMRNPAADAESATESLQERLAAHGRRVADAAGNGEDAASERLGGLVESAEHFRFGNTANEAAPVTAGERLAFDEPAHLPWLESADEDDDDGAVDTRRVAMFVAAGLALLAAIVGGIWWSTHRGGSDQLADGSVIAAPAEPYKTAPAQPGGKTYEGTGDSSFAVSQGHVPSARLAGSDAPAAAPANGTVRTPAEAGAVAMAAARAAGQPASPAPSAASAPDAAPGGLGVQVGAYTSQATAEAGWNKLVRQYPPLGEIRHRIVQGQADIGTVYRLQAVPGSEAAASSLCSAMKAQGIACQVKR